MQFNDIPATDDSFYSVVTVLRSQVTSAIDKIGKKAEPNVVEGTLDTLITENVLYQFEKWEEQKPGLEAMLIKNFLDVVVRINMEPERERDQRYQYSLATEGRCMKKHKSPNIFGFTKGEIIPKSEVYTYKQLSDNWKDIFVLDEQIEKDKVLRNSYAPRCLHDGMAIPALILTTQHQLRIVDKNGNYVKGTNISYCRTKSGVGYLIKLVEYLTDLRANGEKRSSIDDYLATLSREHEGLELNKRWVKAMKVIMYVAEKSHQDLYGMVRLKGYSKKDADGLRKTLEKDPEVGNFVKNRPDLEFIVEELPKDKKLKFGEIWLPDRENKICWQVYNDAGEISYTTIEGREKTKHTKYKTDREKTVLEGFTPWHWSLVRRLAPYFIDDYLRESFNTTYSKCLNQR